MKVAIDYMCSMGTEYYFNNLFIWRKLNLTISNAPSSKLNIQLFQLTLWEEKQKAYKAKPQGNMGFL